MDKPSSGAYIGILANSLHLMRRGRLIPCVESGSGSGSGSSSQESEESNFDTPACPGYEELNWVESSELAIAE
jgi:hypothetical protein